MPSGVFEITDIPEDQVATVIANFQLDSPTKIEKKKQSNGKWTVTATFPGTAPKSTKSFSG
jgi:hypothetical protein